MRCDGVTAAGTQCLRSATSSLIVDGVYYGGMCYQHAPKRTYGLIRNSNTGSELHYEVARPPYFAINYVTVENGQLVYVQAPLSDLPLIVQEFLDSLK